MNTASRRRGHAPDMRSRIGTGVAALLFLAVLAGGALAALAWQAAAGGASALDTLDPYLMRVARFTLVEAGLSTLLSILPAVAVAVALNARPDLPGQGLILRLFALPLALPALVVVFGVTGIYGRRGLIATVSSALGMPVEPDIYGLTGILIAHVFFNLPLAVRFILNGLDSTPAEYWRLAAQLGMGPWSRFRLIEWPAIRRNLAGIAGLVFMLCSTSFTVVLTLGGGPRATTLEVAIYQALHFNFDARRAVALTIAQLVLTSLTLFALSFAGRPSEEGFTLQTRVRRYDRPSRRERFVGTAIIVAALAFVALPIASVAASGLAADLGKLVRELIVWQAIATSLALGAFAALLSVLLSLSLVAARQTAARLRGMESRPSLFEWLAGNGSGLILMIPPIVIGAGWFILALHFMDPFALAPFMVVAVNAAMAMPFAVRVLRPAWDTAAARHDRLCDALGIFGTTRLRLIDLPAVMRPLAVSFAFSMALSFGDLGTIALFGSDQIVTLPYLLFQRISSYRTADAAGLALILGALSFALIALADWALPGRAPAGRTAESGA